MPAAGVDPTPAHAGAVALSNTRALIGLTLLVAPGPVARAFVGRSDPATRTLMRMVGVRDLALGLGTATTLRESSPASAAGAVAGAGWLSWGAVGDAVDGIVLALTPGLPRRSRVLAPVAAVAATLGFALARRLAATGAGTPAS